MKTEKNILIAFLLNLSFAIFEFFGGLYTNSIAIMSDALHDAGDSLSIGISYFLEKKSKRKPDSNYTYGYARYSVIGSVITTVILLFGSAIVIYNAIIFTLPFNISLSKIFFHCCCTSSIIKYRIGCLPIHISAILRMSP